MDSTAPGRGRAAPPGPPPRHLPLLATALVLSGCATVRPPPDLPTAEELRRIERVEVAATGAAPAAHQLSASPIRTGAIEGPAPRILLDASAVELLDAVIAASGRAVGVPFARGPGASGSRSTGALLQVDLTSVNLATGTGPDPLTALWVQVDTRLELPADPAQLLGPRRPLERQRHLLADPTPQPLSAWMAEDGAPVRQAVAALSAKLAPALVASLHGAATDVEEDQKAASVAAPPAAPTDVRAAASPASGERVQAMIGGGLLGAAVGAGSGLLVCAMSLARLGGGFGGSLGMTLFGACAAVAVPIGAVSGIVVGTVSEGRRATRALEEARRASARLAGELAQAVPQARLAERLARANAALRLATPADQVAPALDVGLVRLLEEPGELHLAGLELELTLRAADGEPGVNRRLCVGGPGPVPAELWFRDDGALLFAAIDAQLNRGIAWGAAGLDPRQGDGPCAASPPPPEPAQTSVSSRQPEYGG